jgi:hypothetical protein
MTTTDRPTPEQFVNQILDAYVGTRWAVLAKDINVQQHHTGRLVAVFQAPWKNEDRDAALADLRKSGFKVDARPGMFHIWSD